MVNSTIALSMRENKYETPKKEPSPQDTPSTSQLNDPLNLEKPIFEPPLHPPKLVLHQTTRNPNA